MASRTTSTLTRLAKHAAPSTSRLPARAFSSSPSALFAPTPSPHDSAPTGSRLYSPSSSALQAHLSELLAPLGCELKPETAERAMTSKGLASTGGSVKENGGKTAHSEKLVFLGRRALRMHFTLFLHSTLSKTPSLLAQHLSQKSVDTFLATHALGAGPGRALRLEQAMRWREVRGPTGEPTGLFKSRGQALEALVGAVYMEHGIAASSKVFHELVLPHLAFETRLAQALDAGGAEVGVEPEALRQAVAVA